MAIDTVTESDLDISQLVDKPWVSGMIPLT